MQDDEILDDDFDIEDDFDDDFDLDDESGISVSEDPVSQPVNPTGQKTLIQKLFVPIVVGVVAIFGLIFAASQGLFSSQPQPTIPTENIVVDTDAPDVAVLPESAPVVIEEEPEDTLPPVEEIASAPEPNLPEMPEVVPDASTSLTPLTPLPSESANELESIELVDLDAELKDNSNNLDTQEADIEALALIEEEPMVVEEEPVIEALEPTDLDASSNELEAETIEDIVAVPPGSEIVEDNVEETIEEMPLEAESIEVTEVNDDVQVLKDEKSTLMEENASLEQDIAEKRQTIAELTSNIEALRAEQEALKMPEPEKQPEPVEVVDIPVEKEPEAKPVRVTSKVVWELRSAQPGKATLSASGSNDLKNVEIGSVLAGLGRIKSIQVENGLWVVRGTKGTISQ